MILSRCGFRTVLVTIALLFCAPLERHAFAQVRGAEWRLSGNAPSAGETRREFAISYYMGGARTQSSSLTISQSALATQIRFDGVRYRGRSLDGPLYYGIRGGMFTGRFTWLGFEAELVHLKVFSNPDQRVSASGTHLGQPIDRELPLGEIVQRFSISHGVNLLLLNVVGRHRIKADPHGRRSRIILEARFGAGLTLPHTESTIDEHPQEQFEVGRLAFQLGSGAKLRLKGGLYAIGEYKFTRTRQRGSVFMGEAESLLRSQHGIVGLSYHF
ncbi:MAG TPA: hypothetical protein VGV87_27355 [Blastocatellia bacterium]|jgi:hypothetical protein|nr:hypothetical protein [Blastocatellia bacterium]